MRFLPLFSIMERYPTGRQATDSDTRAESAVTSSALGPVSGPVKYVPSSDKDKWDADLCFEGPRSVENGNINATPTQNQQTTQAAEICSNRSISVHPPPLDEPEASVMHQSFVQGQTSYGHADDEPALDGAVIYQRVQAMDTGVNLNERAQSHSSGRP